ncbi:MAG: hypothetical protein WAN35_05650 [Terracidiphilus sp.]
MKKLLFTLLLLMPALVCQAKEKPAPKPAPNPADYQVAVHVQSSHFVHICSHDCFWEQYVTVLIDGKKYDLFDSNAAYYLLRVGDYKAKIFKDETNHTFEYQRTYEFLLPDGDTRQYSVVAEAE